MMVDALVAVLRSFDRARLFILVLSVLSIGLGSCTSVPRRPLPIYSTVVPQGTHACVAVIGDLQRTSILEAWRERNDAERVALMTQLVREQPDALFLLGDQVFWGSSTDDWTYVDWLLAPVRKHDIPVFPILGNHEYFGSDHTMLEYVSARFPGVTDEPRVVIIDSVAWVLINTNYRDIGLSAMNRQHAWFIRTLTSLETNDSVMFVNVCGHHPPFTNSTVVDDDELLQSYFVAPFVYATKTAYWFSGHTHAFEHFFIAGKHFVVSGGGGGPRQRLLPEPFARHTDLYAGDVVRPFHYCLVQRDADTLTVSMQPLLGYHERSETSHVTKSAPPSP